MKKLYLASLPTLYQAIITQSKAFEEKAEIVSQALHTLRRPLIKLGLIKLSYIIPGGDITTPRMKLPYVRKYVGE